MHFMRLRIVSLIISLIISLTGTIPCLSAYAASPADGWLPVQETGLPPAGYLGGSRLTLMGNCSGSQMNSCVIETDNGSLIVIDGGTELDGKHLQDFLIARHRPVSAWLITHPHNDHAGALLYCLSYPGLTIDHVYYSFAPQDWYETVEKHRAPFVQKLSGALSTLPAASLHGNLSEGDQITVDNVTITVLKAADFAQFHNINDSSVMFSLKIHDKTVLFPGDLGAAEGDAWLASHDPSLLKSDIVQMAHHGQGGTSLAFYEAVRPEVCLWPAPDWLWNNNSGEGINTGHWQTLTTRSWMNYLQVPYHLVEKNGDQTIE